MESESKSQKNDSKIQLIHRKVKKMRCNKKKKKKKITPDKTFCTRGEKTNYILGRERVSRRAINTLQEGGGEG